MNFRVGQGYDVHRLVPGRKLILTNGSRAHALASFSLGKPAAASFRPNRSSAHPANHDQSGNA